MRTIPHRELRNNSSEILAAVKAGETIEVTNNGQVAAILGPPSMSRFDRLVAAGEITPATSTEPLAGIRRVKATRSSAELLDEQRDERRAMS